MEKFTVQLFAVQALDFKDFLEKIEIPYKMRFNPKEQLSPDLIVYFDLPFNEMNYIRISRALDLICNSKALVP